MRGALIVLLLGAGVAGCLSDGPAGVDPRATVAPSGLDVIAQADAPGGYQVQLWDDRAYLATFNGEEGVSIFDVSDPAAPEHVGGLVGEIARSVAVIDTGERRAIAFSTTDQLKVYDVTNEVAPFELVTLDFPSHNVVAHPAGLLYNARNLWDGVAAVEIVDVRDLDDIHLDHVFAFPPLAEDGSPVANSGCHDLTLDLARSRAYCAAYEQTLVWDIADPWAPVVLHAITNPLIGDHHTAFSILGGTTLVIGDEFAANFVWGCWGHPAPPPLADVHTPAGALWFYDLTGDQPEVLSWIGAPTRAPDATILPLIGGPMCTSHNGSEMGPGTGIIAYGWFHAGVMLVDASDPAAPRVLDVDDVGGAVGDARWYKGHVYAADGEVGLTVLAPV